MEKPITRRRALALTGAALATSCTDNNRVLAGPSVPQSIGGAGTWSSGVPLLFAAQEIYPCAHDGAIHLAGGFIAENGRITGPTAAHHTWNPTDSNSAWRQTTSLPFARHHPHLITLRRDLLAFGGFESPKANAVWKMQSTGWSMFNLAFYSSQLKPYDPDAPPPDPEIDFTVETMPALPAPCAEAVVGVLGDGALHLAGGRTPKGEANAIWSDHIDTDHHFVLTSLDGQWETAAPCLTKRNSAAGDVIDGNLHVVGGRTVGGGNVPTHEVYDHREDRWRNAAPIPQAQGGLAAAAIGNKLYAFGGEYFDNGGGVYKEAWVYDASTDAWSALSDMPNPRHGLGAVALDGKIYTIGGALQPSGTDTSAVVEIFTP